MGPTKIILPIQAEQPPIGPVIVAAHELLDQLYEETDRLLREKEAAIHHLAKALIERDELIGDELEEVFAEVEAANPELLDTFERKIIQFREFAPMPPSIADGWTPPPTPDEGQQERRPRASGAWTRARCRPGPTGRGTRAGGRASAAPCLPTRSVLVRGRHRRPLSGRRHRRHNARPSTVGHGGDRITFEEGPQDALAPSTPFRWRCSPSSSSPVPDRPPPPRRRPLRARRRREFRAAGITGPL